MRIDKNILYILAFFGLMLIVNSLIISPVKMNFMKQQVLMH